MLVPLTRARLLLAAFVATLPACESTPPTPPEPGEVASSLQIASGNAQEATVGYALSQPVAVKVSDDRDRPVPGQPVAFVVMQGGGSVQAGAGVSDAFGIARDRWTLGTSTAEPQRLEARLIDRNEGEIIARQLFTATARPGPAAGATKAGGDEQRARPGTAVPESLAVRVVDQYGNPVPGVTVTWSALSGGGTASPAASVTDSLGLAKTRYTLGTTAGTQTIRYTPAGLAPGTFSALAAVSPEGVIAATEPLSHRPFGVTIAPSGRTYITQLDLARLARLDLPSFTFGTGVAVGLVPTDVAFNPTGTRAYVANQFSQSISVVNAATNVEERVIPVTGDPFKVIISPDGTRVYVVTNADHLYAIDLQSGAQVGSIPFTATPDGLAFHPNGYILYVTTRAAGTTVEVDTRTMAVLRTFHSTGLTQEVVVAPDGSELYVANENGYLEIWNLATGSRSAHIFLGGQPFGMAMTADYEQLYVSQLSAGRVTVLNRTTRAFVRTIQTGGVPRRIAFSSEGSIAVITNEAGYVTFVR